MHSCMLQECIAYEPRPLWYKEFCTAVILSGKEQNGDTTRAYSVICSLNTPDAHMSSPYGDTLLLEFVLVGHVRIATTWRLTPS